MEGAYEDAIKTATRTIISTAETQPSANIGAALAERAFSRDALIHRDILNNSRSCGQCEEDIRTALEDYRLAEELGYRHGNIVEMRITILKSLIHDSNEDDVLEDNIKQDSLVKLLALLNMDRHKLDILLSSLRELSPITPDNQEEYLRLFNEAAEGDEEKANQIRLLVESIFS